MKNKILPGMFFIAYLVISFSAHSQSDQSAYTITDSVRDGAKWNYLRTMDMQTGAFSTIQLRLLNNNELVSTNTLISNNGVAALAYDKKNKRVYYTPLLTDRLSYIDLRTMRTVVVTNSFTGLMPKASDQSNIITRMIIGDDDKGYALTNDGLHLFRFKTSNNQAITDLGSLVDAPGNNEMSVHTACSSFGGDLIADDDNHLYLFTLHNLVYKINIQTRVAKYLGSITGLPANFTTSGAAVDKTREKIIIVSVTDASGVYSLNLETLVARKLNAGNPWHASDLASSYLLKDRDKHYSRTEDVIVSTNSADNDNIQLYPNPVTAKEFKIQFSDTRTGVYTIEVMDISGKLVLTKEVSIGKSNIVSINLPEQVNSGIYIVRVTDSDKKALFSGKIVVQR